jgi:putative drug exporter of the RND superfamily
VLAAWFVVRHRRAVLVLTALLLVGAGVVGAGITGKAEKGNLLNSPSSESSRAAKILADQFGQAEPNLVVVVTARPGTVDLPAVPEEGLALTAKAGQLIGSPASSYWALGSLPSLRSKNGAQALMLGRIPGARSTLEPEEGRVI